MSLSAVLLLISFLAAPHAAHAAVSIESKINDGAWSKKADITPLKKDTVKLRVKEKPGTDIRWYQIFPDLSKYYKNANHPWEPNAYSWIGFGKIKYYREEIPKLRGKWQFTLYEDYTPGEGVENPTTQSQYFQRDVGSFWFQAEVVRNGKKEVSPGIKDSDHRGLSPKVFRVSFRKGPGYLGYVTSYFNVPGVFGSVPYQSNNHIGADCADLLMAAHGKWKGQDTEKNYNVAMLVNRFEKTSEFELREGVPDKKVRWGRDVRPGDFIAVRYAGARQYQHIGALAEDSNKNGVLDEMDMILHAGPYPLAYDYLTNGAFDGHVAILRP